MMIAGAVVRSERMIAIYRELQNGPRFYEEIVARFSDKLTPSQVKRALGSLSGRGFIEFNGKWRVKK